MYILSDEVLNLRLYKPIIKNTIMAIFYKLQYRENKTNPKATGYFARVSSKGMITTDEVAEEIQRNCSMKRSDVLAVLAELSEVLKNYVQQSHSVKLDGLGVFRPGISSTVAPSPDKFNAATNIRGLRLNFLPETVKMAGKRMKSVFVNARTMQDVVPAAPGGESL